ncbi:TPA: hypothetical protein DEP96_04355 [Candidatus Uhrbacteria bacterium]|nr:hypothetical protein [Candidatus Uhrbacteria bacterium]
MIDYQAPSGSPIAGGGLSSSLELERAIHERIEEFDKNYSRFRHDGWIERLATQAGTYAVPADGQPLLALYEKVYRLTDGAVTPLIGQVLVDAGYDAEYSLVQKRLLRQPLRWEDVIDYDGGWRLTMKQPAILDFGAAGKGYLVDLIAELLISFQVTSFTVDAGGDMVQRSITNELLRVGLEHPEDTAQVIGVVELGNRSLCGSAGNRRKWGEYHHIVDPRTLTSPRNILAVWVLAETTMLADALTTCLFFVEPEVMLAEFRFDYLIMYADQMVVQSPGFAAELFTG